MLAVVRLRRCLPTESSGGSVASSRSTSSDPLPSGDAAAQTLAPTALPKLEQSCADDSLPKEQHELQEAEKVVSALLQAGASITAANSTGMNAVMLASEASTALPLQLLLQSCPALGIQQGSGVPCPILCHIVC